MGQADEAPRIAYQIQFRYEFISSKFKAPPLFKASSRAINEDRIGSDRRARATFHFSTTAPDDFLPPRPCCTVEAIHSVDGTSRDTNIRVLMWHET